MNKFLLSLSAVLATTGGLVAATAPAAAQHREVIRERTVVHHDGPRYRGRSHSRRVCEVSRRHGHRERVCRTVRYHR